MVRGCAEGHFDGAALGGRYTGLICPHSIENTITGGWAVQPVEAVLAVHGARQPGHTGRGVDAAQFKNIRSLNGIIPAAVVVGGVWYGAPLAPELMAREMAEVFRSHGVPFQLNESAQFAAKCIEQEAAIEKWWRCKAIPALDRGGPDHWLSILDCHI
jgi:hypothetical protein